MRNCIWHRSVYFIILKNSLESVIMLYGPIEVLLKLYGV